ncbi:hypothetical protein AGMMS49992_20660 [Clostridia bacterium]|nr:hypothetical protein AGMMS49992_20660 [Clostridia bacterium]
MLFAEFDLDAVAEVRVTDQIRKTIYNLTKQGLDDIHISDALDVPLSKVDEYRREYAETVEKIFPARKNV